jgi:D-inositol-3-phosphate glycosyltransferase
MNLYVRRLADELAREGLGVDVFTRRTDRQTPEVVYGETGARFVHLTAGPTRRLPKKVLPLHVPALVSSLRTFVQRERAVYDVVHAHYWLSGLVAIRSRSFLDAPSLTMFHTLSRVKEQFSGRPDSSESDLRADGEKCVIRGSDVIVGATPDEEALMKDLYGESPRLFEVIPPGVDVNFFQPRARSECRRELGWGDGRVILFVGRFDPMKGLDTLLHSVADVRSLLPEDTKVIVIGGDGAGASAYRRLAKERGIGDIVQFLGVIAPSDLPAYYSAADICAVPSIYESFGMAAVEAMACGTPVVAFGIGGLAGSVRHLQSGLLVEPGNRDAFGLALARALNSIDLICMGRRARLQAEQFDWRKSVDDTRALYDALVANRQCFCQWIAGA